MARKELVVVAVEVTVVIPTRNRRQLLLRTLSTVLAQEGVDLAVVVVDEGSADGTSEALTRLHEDRLTVVRHEQPKGVSAARNAGIAAATGEWVAFVDDDDMWSPQKLRAQRAAVAAQPGARWACAGAVRVDPALRLLGGERAPATVDVADALLARNVIPGGASGVIAQTELVREVGGFDTELSNMADYDLWIRLGLASPLGLVDRPLVGYYLHTAGMAHNVRRSEQELVMIEEKYRTIRRERGVEIRREQFLWYFGAWYLRQGQRLPAMRVHLDLALRGDERRLRALAIGAVGGVWPGLQGPRDRARGRRLSPAWQQEADSWLAPLRVASAQQRESAEPRRPVGAPRPG